MRPLATFSFCAVAALVHGPTTAAAQIVSLSVPAATLEMPFSFVRGVRELSDGRLLIADYIENRVVLANLVSGTVQDVLTDGAGPRHVRLPMGIVALGDSSLVMDYGNSRTIVLDPVGRVVRASIVEQPGRLFVRGLNRSGEWLYAVPAWSEGPAALPNDSVRIVRWRPGTDRVTTVFTMQGTRYRQDRGPSLEPRIPTVGFAGQDAWVVLPDGGVRVVRHSPFRVERMTADGRWTHGPEIAVTTRPVTSADKRRHVLEFAAASPRSGRGPDGGMGRGPMPSAAEVSRLVETTEWAPSHPAFDAAGVFAAPRDHVWVLRETDRTRPAFYDVFDGEGRRVRSVRLPAGRRVVLVTARGVYTVRESEDGEQFVERFAMP
jgi:hypothetical protein